LNGPDLLQQIERELATVSEATRKVSPDMVRDLYALIAYFDNLCIERQHEGKPHRMALQCLSGLALEGRELWPAFSEELYRLFESEFERCREECDRAASLERYQI
jgi:hypothetical protein